MSAIIKTGLPENDMALDLKIGPNGTAMSEEAYLKMELGADIKHEYIDGHAFAMSGASYNHNLLSGNLFRKFGNHLEGKPCIALMADIKVKAGRDYFYPDVIVDCGNPSGQDYCATSPVMIVEVLSGSTRNNDLTIKLIQYINLPSLQEYVLVEQDVALIQVLRKRNDWRVEYFTLGTSATFESIGLTLTALEIYDRVDNREINEFRQEQLALAAKLAEQQETTGS